MLQLVYQGDDGRAVVLPLAEGVEVTVGRSAEATIRTRNKSVSRKHARISYIAPDMVEIENLSGNGTLVDGKLVDKIILTDCREKTHKIQLGPRGVLLRLQPGSLPI